MIDRLYATAVSGLVSGPFAMRNIHERLKPPPGSPAIWEGGPVNGLLQCCQRRYEL
jgi:hypothetical protein